MADPARTTDMKLSEAIRLGAMLGPQAFSQTHGANDSTCAAGAALRAIGLHDARYSAVCEHWAITCAYAHHPLSGDWLLVLSIIRLLNDEHCWTREQIADWVSTIESPQPIAEPVTVRVEIES